MSRIRVFDKAGNGIAEIEAICNRSWILSDVGEAQFSLSIFDKKCKREIIEFGNLILVEHERLPAWGGVIDTPREWGNGQVTVHAYSAEKLFDYRIGPLDQKITGTAGRLFQKILDEALKQGWMPVEGGIFESDGKDRKETLNPTSLLDEMRRVWERSGGDFILAPRVDDQGRLRFVLNYYADLRFDTQFVLKEGHNIALSNRALTEQGRIVNWFFAFGDGDTWESRPQFTGSDAESISRYGLRQDSKQFSGVEEVGTLQKHAENILKVTRAPQVMLDVEVLDVGDAWLNCRPGAVVWVELHSAGFWGDGIGYRGQARIIGMELDEGGQKLRILTEVL